jgi:OOP family OmpA-OmpF porin
MRWFMMAYMLCGFAQAQTNLVPNGGFEDLTRCPDLESGGAEIWIADPWNNIVNFGGGADIYNVCAQLQIITTDTFFIYNVPKNGVGFQHAHSGNGYAGFYAISDPETYPDGREFIQTPLNKPLSAGVRYEVKFHISLADKFQYATGSLGVHFSNEPLYAADLYLYELPAGTEPQIQSPVGVIYDNKEEWMEIRDTLYIPRTEEGGQQWMTIGNFLPDSLSQITYVDSGAGYGYDRSYYYIDDVSVIALDSVPSGVGIDEVDELSFSVFPNPATETLNIKSALKLVGVRVLDMRGRSVFAESIGANTHAVDLKSIQAGIYILEVTDEEGRRATERFIKTAVP